MEVQPGFINLAKLLRVPKPLAPYGIWVGVQKTKSTVMVAKLSAEKALVVFRWRPVEDRV
jgi:hypothetical protein